MLLAAEGPLWFWLCGRLEQGARAAIAEAGANGWIVTTGPRVRAGWPFAAELRIAAIAVAGDPALMPDALAWGAGRVRLRLGLFDPLKLHVYADGRQTIRAGTLGPTEFETASTDLAVPLNSARPPTLTVLGLSVGHWTVASMKAVLLPDGADAEIQGVTPPDLERGGLPEVRTLQLHAALTRPVPPGPSPASRAQFWRAAGGSLEVTGLRLEWGPLTVTGQVTLRLDENLQPNGAGAVEATGLRPALDLVGKAGLLPAQTLTAARAVLTILGGSDPSKPLRLPVRVGHSVIEVAGFPLLRMAPIDWGPP